MRVANVYIQPAFNISAKDGTVCTFEIDLPTLVLAVSGIIALP